MIASQRGKFVSHILDSSYRDALHISQCISPPAVWNLPDERKGIVTPRRVASFFVKIA